MGDENTILSQAEARHLLRRTGFGAPHAQVDAIVNAGRTRGSVADQLLAFKPSKFKPAGGTDVDKRVRSWVKYMINTNLQLQEKLVLFWHDHFATSDAKVENPRIMANQNQLLRKFCKGNFKDFVKAINTDAAMEEFLDTVRNYDDDPNENYARELQELFTLGVKDVQGNPNYTQADIVQIARAFTGWDYDYPTGKPRFDDYNHDYMDNFPERGPKVIYQSTGGFGSGGRAFATGPSDEGAGEIDAVIDIIFDHTDSDGKKTVARFIAGKLFSYFAQPMPKRRIPTALVPVIDAIITTSGFDTNWELSPLLRAMFVHDAFYATAAPPVNPSDKKSVKWPFDYAVSTLRLLNVRLFGRYSIVNGGDYRSIDDHLDGMGQDLFAPPSVFGWDTEGAWLSSATLLSRYAFARDIIAARGSGTSRFRPQRKLIDLSLTDPDQIVTAVATILGVNDDLDAAARTALIDYLTDGNPSATVDLHNYDVRNTKLHGLFALVMQSPAYQLH